MLNHHHIGHIYRIIIISIVMVFLQGCLHDDEEETQFSIGGTVSGLTGSVVVKKDNEPNKTVTENGAYSFGNGFGDGATYTVSIVSQPSGQKCTISNQSGTVSGADVDNVNISCVSHQDASGIYKGSAELNTEPKSMPDDLRGIVYDNRIYVFSTSQNLLFDGVIAEIDGNVIKGTADVYIEGVNTQPDVVMEGFASTADQLSLTIKGTGKGSAEITLTYDNVYERGAVFDRINDEWYGTVYGQEVREIGIGFNAMDDVYAVVAPYSPPTCVIRNQPGIGEFTIPNPGVNIFKYHQFKIEDRNSCPYSAATNYEGYTTAVDNGDTDNEVWLVLVNGSNSIFVVFNR